MSNRTYLKIPHARVCVKPGVKCWPVAHANSCSSASRPVLTQTRRDGPIWAHFVAGARLVYIKYTAAIAV